MTDRLAQRSTSLALQPRLISLREAFARARSAGGAWHGLDDIAHDLHLSVDELGGALGIGSREVEAIFESDDSTPLLSEDVVNRISSLADLHAHLRQTFRAPEAIPLWMRTDSRYLGGHTPAEVLSDGRIGRVEAALEALDYGAFV